MNEDQQERLIVSFEKAASALEGIHEQLKHAGTRYWPEPKPQREPVVSRVPTEEDLIRERQGDTRKVSIEKWLNLEDSDDPIIGERTAKWLKDHPPEEQVPTAGAKPTTRRKPRGAGAKKAESNARGPIKDTGNHSNNQSLHQGRQGDRS